MSQPEYRWRQLTPKQRSDLLDWRKERGHPWHSPPHRPNYGELRFHITAACFEHRPYSGRNPARMDDFARDLLALFAAHASQRSRGVCCRIITMRSDRHFWATLNYVHHNPARHGYVERWTDWPWSSAPEYLAQTDPEEAKRIWREYPLGDYGAGWDDPAM